MSKQFSKLSTVSAQQLAQLDGASEGKLNELLDRLEAERERIPVEDRPIIDWGISITRAKLLEQEELIREMSKDFKSRFASYESFTEYAKWDQSMEEAEFDQSLKTVIHDTAIQLWKLDPQTAPREAEKCAIRLNSYITKFYAESPYKDSQGKINRASEFCQRKAQQLTTDMSHPDNSLRASTYRALGEGLIYQK